MRLHNYYAHTIILFLLLIHQHGSEHISAGLIILVILVLNNLETGEAVYYQARVHKEYVATKSSLIITKVIRHTFVQWLR